MSGQGAWTGLAFLVGGVPCRLAARRPGGRVLVEFLHPRSRVPLKSWRECLPHELRADGKSLTIEHIKRLIGALPEAVFVEDRPERAVAINQAGLDPEARAPWWTKI